MHNITVAVPEETYRKAKIRAAELDTSVSALVRAFLEKVVQTESDFERRHRLQDEVLATVTRFRAGDRLSRAEAHDRRAIR
jgi:plasmid stability protein